LREVLNFMNAVIRFLKKYQYALINIVRGHITLLACNFAGYWLYRFLLNDTNKYALNPSLLTAVFSFVLFLFSAYIFAYLTIEQSFFQWDSEKYLLKDAYRESDYEMRYSDFCKQQLKYRLWGYYVSAILTQAPILYNYACVEALGRNVSLYKTPIDIYKWNMTNLFPYELLGDSWRFGPLLYTLLFSVIFTIFVFSHQKRHWIKPQHFAKCYK